MLSFKNQYWTKIVLKVLINFQISNLQGQADLFKVENCSRIELFFKPLT